MSELSELRNIGLRSAEWLKSVGIETFEDLREIGVVEAYVRVKEAYPDRVSLNLLYALQGGILDIEWHLLPQRMKDDLRRQVGE
jgi:DNA transformation protein